jgi:hypothetical protein
MRCDRNMDGFPIWLSAKSTTLYQCNTLTLQNGVCEESSRICSGSERVLIAPPFTEYAPMLLLQLCYTPLRRRQLLL